MKVLFVCDGCGKLHTREAAGLVLVRPDMGVTIMGQGAVPLRIWDMLGNQLPTMVRHSCRDGREGNEDAKQADGQR